MWKSLAGDFLKDKSSIDKIDLCNKKTKKESEREKINHIPKQNDPGKKNLKTKKHSFWKVNLERFIYFFLIDHQRGWLVFISTSLKAHVHELAM